MSGAGSIRLGRSSVSISRFAFLEPGAGKELREFLDRTFSVDAVRSVDLDRHRAEGVIRFEAGPDLAALLRSLGRALRLDDARPPDAPGHLHPGDRRGCDVLYLD